MRKVYVIQMEEIMVSDDSMETIEVWEDFYDPSDNLDETKRNAVQLVNDIKEHKISEVFKIHNPDNYIGVCISVYDEENNTILEVIEIEDLPPEKWNVKCGSCGAYCSEGTCSKYGSRVDENTLANDCYHTL